MLGSTPTSSLISATPTDIQTPPQFDTNGPEAKKIVAWISEEQTKAKQARAAKVLQWNMNLAYFYGHQWVERTRSTLPEGYRDQLYLPKRPYYQQRKVINRTRSFVRTELSKFVSQNPTAVAVPATAEDQDVRSAYAAEQAWESIQDSKKFQYHFSRAAWWMILTGNGFIKTWWDNNCTDPMNPNEQGDIRFGNVTPFHLFVPDLREQDIEDQPFVINAYKKTVEWCNMYYGDLLEGKSIAASSSEEIVPDGTLNLQQGAGTKDSVTLYETWIKPGATKLLPQGGLVISIDDQMVSISPDGMPYQHGMYPFTKFEHIPTSTFYADSPLIDTNTLQKEYNTLRSDISEAGRRMARPQLIVQKGALVPSQLTNEPGLVIEYKPGFQPPQPIPLTPLPEYYVVQQDRILSDWEELSGQHEVSKGGAPAGITAGTAINYLQEKDDQYLTPQYMSIEYGTEKIATEALGLFVQYVDMPRKIKVVGADGAFDTQLLSGADIASGTDIRVERGSSVSHSKAAQDSKTMDMFQMGIIDQPNALRLLEVGGVQKVMDIMNAAEKKAQRENIKMKMLTVDVVNQHAEQAAQEFLTNPPADASGAPMDMTGMTPEVLQQQLPPIVTVADFDIHEQHIETHNRFRMSQEYEALDPIIQDQFAKHVAQHQQMYMQGQMMNFLNQVPSDGTDQGGEDAGPPAEEEAAPGSPDAVGAGATMAANGAVPDASPSPAGAPIG